MSEGRGFTLVELLVVILMVSVLIALVLPAVSGANNQSYRLVCANNVRQIGIATLLYLQDWTYFPAELEFTYGGATGWTDADDTLLDCWWVDDDRDDNVFYCGIDAATGRRGDPDTGAGMRAYKPASFTGNADGIEGNEERPINTYLNGERRVFMCPEDSGVLTGSHPQCPCGWGETDWFFGPGYRNWEPGSEPYGDVKAPGLWYGNCYAYNNWALSPKAVKGADPRIEPPDLSDAYPFGISHCAYDPHCVKFLEKGGSNQDCSKYGTVLKRSLIRNPSLSILVVEAPAYYAMKHYDRPLADSDYGPGPIWWQPYGSPETLHGRTGKPFSWHDEDGNRNNCTFVDGHTAYLNFNYLGKYNGFAQGWYHDAMYYGAALDPSTEHSWNVNISARAK